MGQTIGSLGAAFKNPTTFEAEPSGFSGSEWAARLMGGAAKGAGQGLMNQQQRPQAQGGGQIQPPPTTQPQVDLASTIRQSEQDPFNRKPTRDPFYGV